MPGGIPVSLPVPEVKLPKKKTDKPDKPGDALKITLASVDGTLRLLREKDILLQTAPHSVLRFRLLAKTQFRDKQGEPIRDSLLHPGDQLSIEVNTDDDETALRVVFVRAGTPAERAAAERPPEDAALRAPRADDFGKTRTVAVETTRADSTPESAPGGAVTPARIPLGASDEQILRDARATAASFSATLPDFLARQVVTRSYSVGFPAQWQTLDVVTADIAYTGGKEQYRNLKVNGEPAGSPPERAGFWSKGEYSSTLEDVLSVETRAAFKRRGEDRVRSRPAVVFDFAVEQSNSHWNLVAPDQRTYSPAYEGSLWIDRETSRVLRIEQRTTDIPEDFPTSRAESTVEYAFVKIDRGTYLMPSTSQVLGCMRGSGACTKNVIEFQDYRKFAADSVVKY